MEKYLVHIERNGERLLVGTLVGESYRDACFSYSTDYLSDPLSKAISLQLPLQEAPFSTEKTKKLFRWSAAGGIYAPDGGTVDAAQ